MKVRVLNKKTSKYIVLKYIVIWMAISVYTAVIYLNNFIDLIIIDYWTNRIRRIGVD